MMSYGVERYDRGFTSWAGTKFLTSSKILITTCSATETTLEPDT